MKKFLLSSVLAGSLALSACAKGPNGTTISLVDIIAGVQGAAIAACGYEPTAKTITDIFLSGNSLYGTVTGIVDAICGAVRPQSVLPRFTLPTVAGVPVKGRFVH